MGGGGEGGGEDGMKNNEIKQKGGCDGGTTSDIYTSGAHNLPARVEARGGRAITVLLQMLSAALGHMDRVDVGKKEFLVPFPIYPHLTVRAASRPRRLAGIGGVL